MGFAKAFEPLEGSPPLERITRVLEGREFLVVSASADVIRVATLAPAAFAVITNDEPERGMTHSLHLALPRIPRDRPFGILLADMPFVTGEIIASVETLLTPGIDVVFPCSGDVPGHPVIFAPNARATVESLRDGDTLRYARDDESLRRVTVDVSDRSAFRDLNEPADWNA